MGESPRPIIPDGYILLAQAETKGLQQLAVLERLAILTSGLRSSPLGRSGIWRRPALLLLLTQRTEDIFIEMIFLVRDFGWINARQSIRDGATWILIGNGRASRFRIM